MMIQTFTKTFVELFVPYVVVAVAAAETADYRLTVTQLVIGAVIGLAGGLVALFWLVAQGPAGTRLAKAIRSAAEKAAVGLGALVVNEVADIVALPRLLVPVAVGVVGAFAITWLMNAPAASPAKPATT